MKVPDEYESPDETDPLKAALHKDDVRALHEALYRLRVGLDGADALRHPSTDLDTYDREGVTPLRLDLTAGHHRRAVRLLTNGLDVAVNGREGSRGRAVVPDKRTGWNRL